MTILRVDTKYAAGTQLMGYVAATYEELVNVYGPPDEGEGYKVRAEWVLKDTATGAIATIYDWKESIPVHRVTDWHIGGNSIMSVALVRQDFSSAMKAR